MKPTYTNNAPRAAFAILAAAVSLLIGLSIEGLAGYTTGHALQATAQTSIPAPVES